jgi:hypothetical protein
MWGTDRYPIEIVELEKYWQEADQCFGIEEHERLRSFLAFNPEVGHVQDGTGGVRVLQWRCQKSRKIVRIAYYFHDLNMPLYVIALYKRASEMDVGVRAELKKLVDELVAQYREEWSTIILRQLKGGKEPA